MKQLSCCFLLLAGLLITATALAQTKKAPARRPGSAVGKPATTVPGQSAPAPAAPTGLQAAPENRRNSTELPQAVQQAPAPAVTKPPEPVVQREQPLKRLAPPAPPVSSGLRTGDILLNAGFGFPKNVTLLDINGEYMVSNNVGLGGTVLLSTASGGGTALGLKGNFHLARPLEINNRRLDPWAGLTLTRFMSNGQPIFLGGQIGLRYMYKPKFGLGAVYNVYFGNYSALNNLGVFFSYKIGKK